MILRVETASNYRQMHIQKTSTKLLIDGFADNFERTNKLSKDVFFYYAYVRLFL